MPAEPILIPELPIVDPHHHLWDRRHLLPILPPVRHPFEVILRQTPRYLLDELLTDLNLGHNVTHTVHVECGSMYRLDGPEEMKPIGETEFVNGVAAMGDSGGYGPVRPCAGIVGHADLTRGAAAQAVLEAHVAASARFRGVRHSASWDADPGVAGRLGRVSELYRSATFREGFAQLAPLGLSFDAWMFEPQLPDLIDLARAFPETSIVLDHVGTPLGIAAYAGRREERFDVWRESIRGLAACENVVVKVGGLAMPFGGFEVGPAPDRPYSEVLAAAWRPYVETCFEAFGAERCMFESNFPVDLYTCTYDVLWNAFKRLAEGWSDAERLAAFSGTATRIYRLA